MGQILLEKNTGDTAVNKTDIYICLLYIYNNK